MPMLIGSRVIIPTPSIFCDFFGVVEVCMHCTGRSLHIPHKRERKGRQNCDDVRID